MNQETIKVMFALLRSAVCESELSAREKELYKPEMLSEIKRLTVGHDVAHLVALGLKNNKLSGADEVQGAIFKAVCRHEQFNYEYTKWSCALEKAGIPFILLKGGVICNYYPEPWMRTRCDTDVLVHKEDADRAAECLCEAGFEQTKGSTHDYGFFSPSKVHIELHFSLSQDGKFPEAEKRLTEVWESTVPEKGHPCRHCMSGELFMLYHIVHMASHFVRGGCGIRPFIDLWILENKFEFEREKLDNILEKVGMSKFYNACRTLSAVWMENKEHTEKTRIMEEYILKGGVYGSERNAAHIHAATGVGTRDTLLGIMFLPRANLEVLYPKLKRYPYLLPYYQVKRWFGIFNKKRRSTVIRLTSARSGVDAEYVKSAKKMLDEVGLGEA